MVLISIGKKSIKRRNKLRRDPDCEFHGFEEFITMVYENIQEDAKRAVKGVKYIPSPSELRGKELARKSLIEREAKI